MHNPILLTEITLRIFSDAVSLKLIFLWNLINSCAIAHRFSAITILFAFVLRDECRVKKWVERGCTMCIHINTHKLFVPCHKLWIFDQSQVSIQNAIEQTIERSFFLFHSIGEKSNNKQPLLFVTALCRFKFSRGTAILRREREYLFY